MSVFFTVSSNTTTLTPVTSFRGLTPKDVAQPTPFCQVRGAGSPTALASSPQRLRTVPRCLPAPPARRPERGDAGGIRAISSATRGTDAVLSFPRSSRLPCPWPLLHSNLREEQLYRKCSANSG
ncbi:hypothetical protein MUG91_G9n133 [Manis pentadactyla]|nr:hypothetical protein MUG91_G9n133 [Manis pentadactyla]